MGRQDPIHKLIRPVTIIVVTHNALAVTAAMLESLRRFPLPGNARLLFVDNASDDGTRGCLQEIADDVILNAENLGFSKAVNQGIEASGGHDVVLLNNDSRILHRDWLLQLQAAAMKPKIGVVGAVLVNPRGEVIHAGAYVDRQEFSGHHLTEFPHGPLLVRRAPYVAFACAYIPDATIQQVGLLDERFFAYYEDADYCYRTWKTGLEVIVSRRVCLEHAEAATVRSNGFSAAELSRKSRAEFILKWGPVAHTWLFEPPK